MGASGASRPAASGNDQPDVAAPDQRPKAALTKLHTATAALASSHSASAVSGVVTAPPSINNPFAYPALARHQVRFAGRLAPQGQEPLVIIWVLQQRGLDVISERGRDVGNSADH